MKLHLLIFSLFIILSTSCTKSTIEDLALTPSKYSVGYNIPSLIIDEATYYKTGISGNPYVHIHYSVHPEYTLLDGEAFTIDLYRDGDRRGNQKQGSSHWRDVQKLESGTEMYYQVHLKYKSGLQSFISEPVTVIIP